MGYYMRFFVTDPKDVEISDLADALRRVDPACAIDDAGVLQRGHEVYAEIEINRRGEGLFDEEIAEHLEALEECGDDRVGEVTACLRNARLTVAVRVLFGGREAEETLKKIDPLWDWLVESRAGLLQADGEGYYDRAGLLLEVN